MKELGLVDVKGDRGLVEAHVAGGGARGLGAGWWRKGTVGWQRPVAGGGIMERGPVAARHILIVILKKCHYTSLDIKYA
jgi:hypothetical protein